MLWARAVANLTRALSRLYARVPMGMRLGLASMEKACAALGHPERAFEAVHVAGTNGKGSVCAMLAEIGRVRGGRVGLYTSPHLARFAERIRIDGEPLDDDALATLLEDSLDRAPDLTFFEVATLAAFRAFQERKVELAVLEVGLGGRLDATNVIPPPRAAAITRIAFDHMDRLGTTLTAIAREKAGIAKPGVEIVLGPLQPEVEGAIEDAARSAGATTRSACRDEEAARFVEHAAIGLPGHHQIDNTKVAYVVARRSLGASEAEVADGIARVHWPGRLETIRTDEGSVLLDAAHNPDGMAALVAHLEQMRRGEARPAVVFGVLADKPWEQMLCLLAPAAGKLFYVEPGHADAGGGAPRRPAVAPSHLVARHPGVPGASVGDALVLARRYAGARGLILVCGSILLVGEARAILLGLPRDPPVPL